MRQQVVEMRQNRMSMADIARFFGVSHQAIQQKLPPEMRDGRRFVSMLNGVRKPRARRVITLEQQITRFRGYIAEAAPDECWLWAGHVSSHGYGRFFFQGKVHFAHRVAFYLKHGHWPNVCRHTCDNPPCCNTEHLLDGTLTDNARDAFERKRFARGADHGLSKLMAEDVYNIRSLDGLVSRKELARAFGVHEVTISSIVRRRHWKDI